MKKKVNLLFATTLLVFGTTQAAELRVVPETFTALPGSEAKFLVMGQQSSINEKQITVHGLPAGATWQLMCTGSRGNNCQQPAGNNDLPILTLTIKIPANTPAKQYQFTLQSTDEPTSFGPLKLQLVDKIPFTHPGVLLNKSMLENLRSTSRTNDAIWQQALALTKKSAVGQLSYQASPHAAVNSDTNQGTDLRQDAIAAYTQALLWTITNDHRYADNAIAIMNAWSNTLQNDFTGQNKFNLAAWTGDVWPRAAEIIRYTYKDNKGASVWKSADIAKFSTMLQQRYINFISNSFYTAGGYGGNLINSQAAAFINIGTFNNDSRVFLQGVEKWRRMLPAYIYMQQDGTLPTPPVFWRNSYITRSALLETNGYWRGQDFNKAAVGKGGIAQETCRDIGHVLWGFSALANGSETARIQGFDLNKESTLGTLNSNRLKSGAEYNVAFLNQPNSGSASAASNPCSKAIVPGSSVGKGELLLNDLQNRRQLKLPQTDAYLKKNRPTADSYFMVWETLTHYKNP